jgi:hypothetical protein
LTNSASLFLERNLHVFVAAMSAVYQSITVAVLRKGRPCLAFDVRSEDIILSCHSFVSIPAQWLCSVPVASGGFLPFSYWHFGIVTVRSDLSVDFVWHSVAVAVLCAGRVCLCPCSEHPVAMCDSLGRI